MIIFKKKLKTIYWKIRSLVVRHYYGNPAKKLKIVGVTGTSGKTTTVTLLYQIALSLGYKVGLISTVENKINGQSLGANDIGPGTTPDSVTLTKIFKKMVDSSCEYVFMEVSSHSIVQNRVNNIHFLGGIFTNLSQDHLDYHKDMEDYFEAKHKAFALTNADDAYGMKMLSGIKANPFTYGFNQDFEAVHFHGEIKKMNFDGLELSFNKIDLKAKLLGKFNAYNLLSVWSACSLLGLDMSKVNKIIETIEPPAGRFQHFTTKTGVIVIVDYAHKPDALEKIFQAVKEVFGGTILPAGRQGKLISVFGCGGDRDTGKRPIMGKTGAVNSDIAIFTSDNPRSEQPEAIIEAMKATLTEDELKKVKTIPDRQEAILESVRLAQSARAKATRITKS